MTPKSLAKRIHGFDSDTVSDEEYRSWCEDIGKSQDWIKSGIDRRLVDRYKEFIFGDSRFEFDKFDCESLTRTPLSLDDYGWLGKNPLVPIYVESDNPDIILHAQCNAGRLFSSTLLKVAMKLDVDTYRSVFFSWRKNWTWKGKRSDFLHSYDSMDELIQDVDSFQEDKKYFKDVAYDLFSNTLDELRDVDQLNWLHAVLAIFSLCRNFEDALGAPYKPHLLSFLDEKNVESK